MASETIKKQITGGVIAFVIGLLLWLSSEAFKNHAVPEYISVLRLSGFTFMIGAVFWTATAAISRFAD
jgi:hypothetical protein